MTGFYDIKCAARLTSNLKRLSGVVAVKRRCGRPFTSADNETSFLCQQIFVFKIEHPTAFLITH